jgi:hypothetical protein
MGKYEGEKISTSYQLKITLGKSLFHDFTVEMV